MKTNSKIIKKLNVNVNNLEEIINDLEKHNKKIKLLRGTVKVGIIANLLLPFALSYPALYIYKTQKNDTPFIRDTYIEYPIYEAIDTSSGIHIEHTSKDFEYDDYDLEYSTGWKLNDKGFYERQSTKYVVSDDVDLNDCDKIFNMSKEEIENVLKVKSSKIISKKVLGPEDYYYDKDGFIITRNLVTKTPQTKKESGEDNVMSSLLYIFFGFCYGFSILKIDKKTKGILYQQRLRLKNYRNKLVISDSEDAKKAKILLKINKDNLQLFEEDEKNDDNNFVLRKR